MAETKKAKTKAELLAEKMEQKRVAQTAFDAGAKPIINTTPQGLETAQDATKHEEVSKDTPEQEKPTSAVQEAPKPTKQAKPKKNAQGETKKAEKETTKRLLDTIPKRKRVEKKTNAYYLSIANIEKLDKAAEKAGTSASDLLDNILTAVLSE